MKFTSLGRPPQSVATDTTLGYKGREHRSRVDHQSVIEVLNLTAALLRCHPNLHCTADPLHVSAVIGTRVSKDLQS